MMGLRMRCVAGLAVIIWTINAEAEDSGQGETSHTVGSTSIEISYPEGDATESPSASISFDKDIVVNGNDLPAGIYELGLHAVAKNDVHVVFGQHSGTDEGDTEGKLTERLRLAVRFEKAPDVDGLHIDIERIERKPEKKSELKAAREGEEDDEDGNEERRGPREPSATMKVHWGGRVAALTLQMTGLRWVGTPPPDIPQHLQDPWALVLHSLNGIVDQNVEMHIEHFADDFASDWHDGGSIDAQVQFFGWLANGGGLEDSVLVLDKMEWTEAEDSVTFRNLFILAPVVQSSLEYTVEKSDAGWQITYLYGPPESHV